MKTNNNPEFADFDSELVANIKTTIALLRKEGGCVAMGKRNLLAVTPTPRTCKGAPMGTNLPWAYAQRFNQAIEQLTVREKAFILPENVIPAGKSFRTEQVLVLGGAM